jgi:PAS domain S-box-containing protein
LIAENSSDIIFTFDQNGIMSYASPSTERILGYKPDERVGKSIAELMEFVKMDDAKVQEEFAKIAKGKPIEGLELVVLKKDGTPVPMEINAVPVMVNGEFKGMRASMRDITEQKRAEETNAQLEALKRMSEMKARFVSSATHELRTPLVSIKGYSDLIYSEKFGALVPKVKEMVGVVLSNTDRLSRLTEDLLDVQRIESGRLTLDVQPADMREIISRCIKEIKPIADKKKQALEVEMPEKPLKVKADPTRLSQVIINLLSNANKFTPEGGKIAVMVRENVDHIETAVSDNGMGLKAEDMKKLFELFPDIKKPANIKGMGLGLSISKGIVEAHGGKIEAHSEGEGKGATFTFTLPKLIEISDGLQRGV